MYIKETSENITANVRLINKNGEEIQMNMNKVDLIEPENNVLFLKLTQEDISLEIRFEKK